MIWHLHCSEELAQQLGMIPSPQLHRPHFRFPIYDAPPDNSISVPSCGYYWPVDESLAKRAV